MKAKQGGLGRTYDEIIQRQIEEYNASEGNLTGYDCPLCKNRGDYRVYENGEQVVRFCQCMEIRKTLCRIEKSGLNGLIKECRLDNFQTTDTWQKNIKEMAERFLSDTSGSWLFIGGQVGCGKTHICTAITGELLKKYSARYMLWRDESIALKAAITDDALYAEMIEEIKRPDVLYIDDFFKTQANAKPSQADVSLAFEIINFRYCDKNKRTIISSERYMDEIIEIDEALGSRIYQRTRGFCINIPKDQKKNYRLKS